MQFNLSLIFFLLFRSFQATEKKHSIYNDMIQTYPMISADLAQDLINPDYSLSSIAIHSQESRSGLKKFNKNYEEGNVQNKQNDPQEDKQKQIQGDSKEHFFDTLPDDLRQRLKQIQAQPVQKIEKPFKPVKLVTKDKQITIDEFMNSFQQKKDDAIQQQNSKTVKSTSIKKSLISQEKPLNQNKVKQQVMKVLVMENENQDSDEGITENTEQNLKTESNDDEQNYTDDMHIENDKEKFSLLRTQQKKKIELNVQKSQEEFQALKQSDGQEQSSAGSQEEQTQDEVIGKSEEETQYTQQKTVYQIEDENQEETMEEHDQFQTEIPLENFEQLDSLKTQDFEKFALTEDKQKFIETQLIQTKGENSNQLSDDLQQKKSLRVLKKVEQNIIDEDQIKQNNINEGLEEDYITQLIENLTQLPQTEQPLALSYVIENSDIASESRFIEQLSQVIQSGKLLIQPQDLRILFPQISAGLEKFKSINIKKAPQPLVKSVNIKRSVSVSTKTQINNSNEQQTVSQNVQESSDALQDQSQNVSQHDQQQSIQEQDQKQNVQQDQQKPTSQKDQKQTVQQDQEQGEQINSQQQTNVENEEEIEYNKSIQEGKSWDKVQKELQNNESEEDQDQESFYDEDTYFQNLPIEPKEGQNTQDSVTQQLQNQEEQSESQEQKFFENYSDTQQQPIKKEESQANLSDKTLSDYDQNNDEQINQKSLQEPGENQQIPQTEQGSTDLDAVKESPTQQTNQSEQLKTDGYMGEDNKEQNVSDKPQDQEQEYHDKKVEQESLQSSQTTQMERQKQQLPTESQKQENQQSNQTQKGQNIPQKQETQINKSKQPSQKEENQQDLPSDQNQTQDKTQDNVLNSGTIKNQPRGQNQPIPQDQSEDKTQAKVNQSHEENQPKVQSQPVNKTPQSQVENQPQSQSQPDQTYVENQPQGQNANKTPKAQDQEQPKGQIQTANETPQSQVKNQVQAEDQTQAKVQHQDMSQEKFQSSDEDRNQPRGQTQPTDQTQGQTPQEQVNDQQNEAQNQETIENLNYDQGEPQDQTQDQSEIPPDKQPQNQSNQRDIKQEPQEVVYEDFTFDESAYFQQEEERLRSGSQNKDSQEQDQEQNQNESINELIPSQEQAQSDDVPSEDKTSPLEENQAQSLEKLNEENGEEQVAEVYRTNDVDENKFKEQNQDNIDGKNHLLINEEGNLVTKEQQFRQDEIGVKSQEVTKEQIKSWQDKIESNMNGQNQEKVRSHVKISLKENIHEQKRQNVLSQTEIQQDHNSEKRYKEEEQLKQFLKDRGIYPEETGDEGVQDPEIGYEDEFSDFIRNRMDQQKKKQSEYEEKERIVVQRPDKPKQLRPKLNEDEQIIIKNDEGSIQYVSRDIMKVPVTDSSDDIFIIQSLSSNQRSNVRYIEDKISVDQGIKKKAQEEDKSISNQEYQKWENNRMINSEKVSEQRGLIDQKGAILPKIPLLPESQIKPLTQAQSMSLVQQAESKINMQSIRCKDPYNGQMQKAKDFVCGSCQTQEVYILDEESWYLIGMLTINKIQHQEFLSVIKTLMRQQTTLLSFGNDIACLASENLNIPLNISQVMTLLDQPSQNNQNNKQILIMPDVMSLKYFQVIHTPKSSLHYKEVKLDAYQPTAVSLSQGVQVFSLGAEIQDGIKIQIFKGQLNIQQNSVQFKLIDSSKISNRNQTLELSLILPRDLYLIDALSNKYFGQDLREQLHQFLKWKEIDISPKLRGQNFQTYSLIIASIHSEVEFEMNFKLKQNNR